jgi:hypothetical protein
VIGEIGFQRRASIPGQRRAHSVVDYYHVKCLG